MVASVGTTVASFTASQQKQDVQNVQPVDNNPQPQASTPDGGGDNGNSSAVNTGYSFTPAANISSLSSNTASALLSAQASDGNNQTTNQFIQQLIQQSNQYQSTQNIGQQLTQQATTPDSGGNNGNSDAVSTAQQVVQAQNQQATAGPKAAYSEPGLNIVA